uniref:Uncharacterized protein n=1 Tax=Moorena producens (strain JHB) TaxID=1454205 RepID=A0A1D9FVL0_MOOP1
MLLRQKAIGMLAIGMLAIGKRVLRESDPSLPRAVGGYPSQKRLYLISEKNALISPEHNFFPCSLFPVPCSLFPVPYSLFSTTTTKSNHYKWGMIVNGDNAKNRENYLSKPC